MHTVFALLCFVVVIHWLIFPYPSGLLHWHCGNLTIAPVPAKQPWWIWINTSCEFIMNDCITTTKQSTTKPCAYFLGYTVCVWYANTNIWFQMSACRGSGTMIINEDDLTKCTIMKTTSCTSVEWPLNEPLWRNTKLIYYWYYDFAFTNMRKALPNNHYQVHQTKLCITRIRHTICDALCFIAVWVLLSSSTGGPQSRDYSVGM